MSFNMDVSGPKVRKKVSIILFVLNLLVMSTDGFADIKFFPSKQYGVDGITWWARFVADINGDGLDDCIIQNNNGRGGWLGWIETTNGGNEYTQHIIAYTAPGGEEFASGDLESGDFDSDGDIDILAVEHTGEWDNANAISTLYWYENPSWTPHRIGEVTAFIKDISVADFNNDNKLDIATVQFQTHTLSVFRQNTPTSFTRVQNFQITNLHEGMDAGDIDGDGDIDLAPNGYWVESPGGDLTEIWNVRVIDSRFHSDPSGTNYRNNASKVSCRDITGDGRADVFISDSENSQPIFWYESSDPRNGNWTAHQIAPTINFVHTSMVYDMDGDGDYDFIAGQNGDQVAGGKFVIYVNEGDNLTWTEQVIDNNGTYNSLVGDANGDGMWDIFRYKGHEDSRMDLFINEASALSPSSDSWKRYQIGSLGKEGLYVTAGDLDGDGDKDMAAAGNWWRNPGSLDGNWPQYTIGSPLNNVLLTHDFDNDGDLDILGSQGVGAESNNNFAWAENNGSGSFTVHTNIQSGGGDFAQGVAIADFGNGEQVMISWHNGANITLLTVPGSPASQTWSNSSLHNSSQDEDLSIGDIDDDGDLDVFQGTMWMENRGGSFVNHTIGSVPSGTPDRNDLADIDLDGDLDAVVAQENGDEVYWFEAPSNPTQTWTRHLIDNVAGEGFSMDVGDMDNDGDIDVVIGEHRGSGVNRVLIYENGKNSGPVSWTLHTADSGPTNVIDHHDGTQIFDMDDDGNNDIISIGWYNKKVWLYENTSIGGPVPQVVAPPAVYPLLLAD